MNKMTVNRLFVLVISSLIFIACQGGSKAEKNQDSATPAEDKTKIVSTNVEIPYIVANRYFVNNTVKSIDSPKITTQAEFDKIFGAATAMGEDGLPTKINFSKQYVIAVIKPETDYSTTLVPIGLQKEENGEIVFSYKVEKGEKQSYTTVPCLIIVVDNSTSGNVVLEEIS